MEESRNLPGSGSVVQVPKILDRKHESPSFRHDLPGLSDSDRGPEVSSSEEGATFENEFSSVSESYNNGSSLQKDDEAMIGIAEEEDVNDPYGTKELETEASVSVEDFLRSRGIDPDFYHSELGKPHGNANGAVGVPESGGDSEDALGATVSRISCYSVDKDASPSTDFGGAPSYSGRTSSGRLTTAADGTPVLDSSSHTTAAKSLLNRNSRHPTDGSQISTPGLLRGSLRSHQLAGVQWLVALYKKNVNGILTDERDWERPFKRWCYFPGWLLRKDILGSH